MDVAKTVTTATRKHAKEGANLFRKAELENEVLQMEVCSLKLDNTSLGSSKAQMKEESTRLKLELEQVRVGIVKENKELKAVYQKQVDDYGYNYYIRKHEITNDIPNISSDNEVKLGEDVIAANKQNAQEKTIEAQLSTVVE